MNSEKHASREELIEAACAVRLKAHAPYSKFKVGASFRLKDGRVVSGINLENCSFGLTVCAERNALATAVADGVVGADLAELASAGDAEEPALPCRAGRQVLAELMPLDAPVISYNIRDGAKVVTCLRELLPKAFLPTSLAAAVNPPGN